MKKSRLLFLLLAGSLLLAGCQKEGRMGGKDAIRFAATSAPVTKTAYSGSVTNGVERIDWVGWTDTREGDVIRIYSDVAEHRYNQGQRWADYIIKDVTFSGALSKGKIENVPGDGTGNGLVWDQPGDYQFYAVYPNLACEQGPDGVLSASIPQNQRVDMSGRIYTPDMNFAVMTAYQKMTTTETGEGGQVDLDFTPAFTAFEFSFDSDIPLEIQSFRLQSAGTGTPITGKFAVKYENGQPVYDCSEAAGRVVDATFSSRANVDKGKPFTFTVFAVPQDIKGLSVIFTVKGEGWAAAETRTLKLNYKDGTPVPFEKCFKHRIKGTMQGGWNFKYITLTGEALEWTEEDVTLSSDNLPQASQFAVSGASNIYELHPDNPQAKSIYRQTWVLDRDGAVVTFKIFSPVDGTYEITPQGDYTGSFTVEGDLRGNINGRDDEGITTAKFSVIPIGAAAGQEIWFKVTVTNAQGETFNIDSETQLYDLRGYHKFRIDDPLQ